MNARLKPSAQFVSLDVAHITPLTDDACEISFTVPRDLHAAFRFKAGQFLTLRARIRGEEVRRSYSICSSEQRYQRSGELCIGVRRVEGGVFSTWATTQLRANDSIEVMPPEGRFGVRATSAQTPHRVAFAAGSGITPILSIISTVLAAEPASTFTLVYCNRSSASVMFGEALQDLKDRYPTRLSLVHLFSRQHAEMALFNGRLDLAKVGELLAQLIDPRTIDEAFVCGPEEMIVACETALANAGVVPERVHSERFASFAPIHGDASKKIAINTASTLSTPNIKLNLIVDGKTHQLGMNSSDAVLDVALAAGLDLPYACKGGVCCTCRARLLEGEVAMAKNFTLEADEVAAGFVLTCQARPLSERVVISFDER
jgi:ring-1,2-phenylacetyl-CoA epoxidase subunit PaaE